MIGVEACSVVAFIYIFCQSQLSGLGFFRVEWYLYMYARYYLKGGQPARWCYAGLRGFGWLAMAVVGERGAFYVLFSVG